METQKKLFAFKLAEAKDADNATQKWTARDGVAIAGCSYGPSPPHGWYFVPMAGADTIQYCP